MGIVETMVIIDWSNERKCIAALVEPYLNIKSIDMVNQVCFSAKGYRVV